MKSMVLVCNFSDEKLKKLNQIFILSNVVIKKIPQEDFCQPVGYLAGAEGFSLVKKSGKAEFSEELFVMCGFTDDKMEMILDILKQNNIQIQLKAVLTKTNAFWSVNQLYKALKTEHFFMT